MTPFYKYVSVIGLVSLFMSVGVIGHSTHSIPSTSDFTFSRKSEVFFFENKGQVHNGDSLLTDVLGIGVSNRSQLILTATGYSHQISKPHYTNSKQPAFDGLSDRMTESLVFQRIDMNWIGAAESVEVEWLNPLEGVTHYYNLPGNCPPVTNVQSHESVRIKGIYPGVDVRYYSKENQFEYDYEIAPFADHRAIIIKIQGGHSHLNTDGELVIEHAGGKIIESAPRVFQGNRELKSNWVQFNQNLWGFEIQGRCEEYAMVIDPLVRVWGTYNGGTSGDEINYIDTDDEGFVYAVGSAESPDNIATAGAHQQIVEWGKDVLVTKLDENGNRIWGTYLGGNGNESAWGCDIKGDGILYFVGRTESMINIATPGAHQEVQGDGGNVFDGFIQRFTSDGQRIWGTYYGGEEWDRFRYCHIDGDGNLYVTGVTTSFTNISSPGSHQEGYMGAGNPQQDDAILVKFDPDGNRLWATYYGGTEWEEGMSCITDEEDNVYFFGHAQSTTNISTDGTYQPNHEGGTWDLFLAKFNSSGVRQWGTYIGGSGQDISRNITIDPLGDLYFTGRTQSIDNIATPGAHQENNGGDFDAFLMKFSNEGNKIWGTYLGGNQFERGYGCEVTDGGFILLSGHTESNNSIVTSEVHQETFGGNVDAFLAKFDFDGAIQWSTYYGGTGEDVGLSCISFSNYYYLAGYTESNSAIATTDIHQEVYGGSRDGFVAKFVECNPSYNQLDITTCEDYTAPDGEVYDESGEYSVMLQDQFGCDSIITINLTISDQIINDQYHFICEGETITLPDGTTTSDEGTITNEYVSFQGCDSLVNHHISIAPDFEHNVDTTICENAVLIDPNGNPIEQAGEYSFLYSTIHGCDSIVHLELDLIPAYNTSHSVDICQGDYFSAPNGEQIYSSGTYEYNLTSSNGCDSVVTYEVNVYASPIAHFSTDPADGSDVFETNIQFFNESIGEDNVLWNFFEYGNSTQSNPTVNFVDSAGVHPICLYAFTEEGCADSLCGDYAITEELNIYIPNAFTPNGDGINDLFFVDGSGIDPEDFLLRVFNRWGDVIFESNDLYKKWDGAEPARTHYAQNEVYTYQVVVGALYHTDKREITGRVTVIR